MFWCVLGANFIAFELSYTHNPASLDLTCYCITVCQKSGRLSHDCPLGLKSERTRPLSPFVDTPLINWSSKRNRTVV